MQSKQAVVVVMLSLGQAAEQQESGSRCSRSKGGFWRAPGQVADGWVRCYTEQCSGRCSKTRGPRVEWDRVESSARHHGGSSEASDVESTAQDEDRSRGENGGGENGNELEMGSGREGGQDACRSRYQGLAAPKEPPHGPLKQVRRVR